MYIYIIYIFKIYSCTNGMMFAVLCFLSFLWFLSFIWLPAPVITTSTPGWEHRKLGCVGVAIGGIDVRILDPNDFHEIPNGQDGEVPILTILTRILSCLRRHIVGAQ